MERITLADGQTSEPHTADIMLQVKENSKATIILRTVRVMKAKGNAKVKIQLAKNSDAHVFLIQQNPATISISNQLSPNARLTTYAVWLEEGQANISSELLEGAQLNENHVFVIKGTDSFGLNSQIKQVGKNTWCKVAMKGLVLDHARVEANGKIDMEKGCTGSDSFLGEQVLLLDKDASAMANPELEIKNNNVSSKHTASVSPIDEKKVYYLMTRGLNRTEAKRIIAEGFVRSVWDEIQDQAMKKEIEETVLAAV